jgi:hypothetical protein
MQVLLNPVPYEEREERGERERYIWWTDVRCGPNGI